MSVLISPDAVVFQNGRPAFDFDECYSCFDDRGILYRLVNTEKGCWAFYNDTTDLIIHVKAQFGARSRIKALQRTEMTNIGSVTASPLTNHSLSAASDTTVQSKVSGKYAFEASLEIEPGFTELFIEGTVDGFTMDFTTESAPAKNVVFEGPGPSCAYDKVYKCFKNEGNGLLFRLVSTQEQHWAFYNDTTSYIMKVVVEFDGRDDITPLGVTEATEKGEPEEGGAIPVTYTAYIRPGKTELFVHGQPSVYKLSFSAEPAKAAKSADGAENGAVDAVTYKHGGPDPAIIPHLSHVFKCFKEHDNGLLFRCVDEANKIWAFYNDTTEYIMDVNVRFPPKKEHEDVAFAPNVQVMDDAEIPGGYIAAAEAPPLATIPFLVGDLTGIAYELAFSARTASKNAPEAHPQYENGFPDLTKIADGRIDEVYKCFKEHGNGLLFRLVTYTDPQDHSTGSWAFYNDTRDITAQVRVSYADKAKVKALGDTKIDTDEELGVVYVAEVAPGQTEPFVEGEIASFTTKFFAKQTK